MASLMLKAHDTKSVEIEYLIYCSFNLSQKLVILLLTSPVVYIACPGAHSEVTGRERKREVQRGRQRETDSKKVPEILLYWG